MLIGLKAKALVRTQGFAAENRLGNAIAIDSLIYSTESLSTDFDSRWGTELKSSINTLKVRLGRYTLG